MSKDIKDFLQGVDNADAVAKIISDNLKEAKCKIFIDDGDKNKYVPISRLNDKIGELNTATTTITTLNQTIRTLKDQVKDNEKATETISQLQGDLDNYKQALKDNKINSALQLCAIESKAHDAKDLKGFLDLNKITINETGEVIGIKEQVEQLKKDKAYLFKEDPAQPQKPGFGGTGVPGKPSSGMVFNSQTAQPGDFGKMLAHENGVPKGEEGKQIFTPEYFFGDGK